ncbi:uncharacterized protein LOC134281475 [Saccostrea cucullata]|uniref:uncharacterized protein LOC134281475 n=1 Tax=Saccostrea cuccullata TaxID=36930 RepID=UPI002ED00393
MANVRIICVVLFSSCFLEIAKCDGNNHSPNTISLETANAIHLSPDNLLAIPSESVIVELNIYSGRDDPYIQMPRAQLHRMLQSSFGWRNPVDVTPGLGYQGFTVYNYDQNPVFIACGSDIGVETGLLQRLSFGLDRDLQQFVRTKIQTEWAQRHNHHRRHGMPNHGFMCPRPPSTTKYEPHVWNNRTFVQRRNNCYNYASNIITNTFAQPGRANRHNFTRNPPELYGPSVHYGTILDGLTPLPANSRCLPNAGLNLIALVIWPGRDYHFYRLDNNGMWSHKPGRSPARNVDNSNNFILDPRIADVGPYTVFKGFFLTNVFDVRHIM